MAGRERIEDLNDALDWDLPAGDFETVAGLVLATVHRLPRVGEEFQVGRRTFTVLEADERRILTEEAKEEGLPEDKLEQIVEGRLGKGLKEIVLLDQEHINADKHEGKTIEDLRAEVSAKTGENVVIRRFARFQVGEEA